MDRSDASALADLQMHWDEAYVITLDGDIWSARYRSSAIELRAHTSSELRELIRSDYAYRQKADLLVAYDADDEDEGESDDVDAPEGDTEGVVTAAPADGDGEADAESGHVPDDDAGKATRQDSWIGSFASIRGERMSM